MLAVNTFVKDITTARRPEQKAVALRYFSFFSLASKSAASYLIAPLEDLFVSLVSARFSRPDDCIMRMTNSQRHVPFLSLALAQVERCSSAAPPDGHYGGIEARTGRNGVQHEAARARAHADRQLDAG
jgi:hypothetical protein